MLEISPEPNPRYPEHLDILSEILLDASAIVADNQMLSQADQKAQAAAAAAQSNSTGTKPSL